MSFMLTRKVGLEPPLLCSYVHLVRDFVFFLKCGTPLLLFGTTVGLCEMSARTQSCFPGRADIIHNIGEAMFGVFNL